MKAVPLSVLSDAGAWLVRLSGPLRTPAAEEGFREWLKESPLHARAFKQVSAEWDEADELKRFTNVEIRLPVPERKPVVNRPLLALAATLAVMLVSAVLYQNHTPQIASGVNELRVVTLEDGSKVHLNTATRIAEEYSSTVRRIRLEFGEALFEVAKESRRPFIVTVGNREIQALGTSFLVRRDEQRVAVTLVNGQAAVSDKGEAGVTQMVPGERLVFSGKSHAQRDRPDVDKLLAWQTGKVAIDNLPLAEAVKEMNRYSATPLVLEELQPESLLVSGVFAAGQSLSFARAMSESYGLAVVERGNAIVLTGTGRSAVEK